MVLLCWEKEVEDYLNGAEDEGNGAQDGHDWRRDGVVVCRVQCHIELCQLHNGSHYIQNQQMFFGMSKQVLPIVFNT